MADRAQVTSVEAIEAFRSALIVYLSKARPALEEIAKNFGRELIGADGRLRRDKLARRVFGD